MDNTEHLVTLSTDPSASSAAELRIDIRSLPYLVDHGFQDMRVVPGSFYVDVALRMHRDRYRWSPRVVRNVTFHHPLILSAEETVIRVQINDELDRAVAYTFSEPGAHDNGGPSDLRRIVATLEIDREDARSERVQTELVSPDAFQAQPHAAMSSEAFYEALRTNGNQYGPSFQNVSFIWRASDRCLGRVLVPDRRAEPSPHYLHPCLTDCITQLLAAFVLENGKTFILRSIERIEIIDVEVPGVLWGLATRVRDREDDEGGLVGNVRAFDDSGKRYLQLWGVAFTLLDTVDTATDRVLATLCIAANFTAEPVEDTLRFWGDYFGLPIRLSFAPYNQIFQQLLDTESLLARNRSGANVILLRLEEWATASLHAVGDLDVDKAGRYFGDRPTYSLSNGLKVLDLNHYETEYLYQEIFADRCYWRHGVQLRDGATVVDIGANIGLFSLSVMTRCANPNILAFEPSPVVYPLLKANCEAYGATVRTFNVGVSDRQKTAVFTSYDKSSVFSSFHADPDQDRAAIRAVVRNMLTAEVSMPSASTEEYVTELTVDRLHSTTHECRLTCISDIIRENGLDRIDLLKIDAEKSEWEIIQGIEDQDWRKINQIVMEIHDRSRAMVRRIEELLIDRGYRCTVEHEAALEASGLFSLYARRPDEPEGMGRDDTSLPLRTAGTLGRTTNEFCAALASFMDYAKVPLVLELCPRSPAADADAELTAALDEAEQMLLSEAARLPDVHTIASSRAVRRYSITNYYDPQGHRLGDTPYTPNGYAEIATLAFRTIWNVNRRPFKVVVLDCDNTLWRGVCGEDGPRGVALTPPYQALQAFMLEQMKAGMLLCLCSKNNERDVLDVFDQRSDMKLRREHLVSHRINWSRKSRNLRDLAEELNLGLDSFIFIDDDPVECADVRINCPDVLTLQLPENAETFSRFLDHVWAFDHTHATREDDKRTRLYQENLGRERARAQTLSLEDFISGLQLRVDVATPATEQLGRVAQLTVRTNQFNLTTIRRSENEICQLLTRDGVSCLAVQVSDRFGDYGLVGVIIYYSEADRYRIETLLLSCRVLGRGVEHAVLASLAQRALLEGKRFVELTYVPTEKNSPVLEFLNTIGDRYRNDTGMAEGQRPHSADAPNRTLPKSTSWTVPVERLAHLEFVAPGAGGTGQEARASGTDRLETRRTSRFGIANLSDRMQRIAVTLADVDGITAATQAFRTIDEPGAAAPEAFGSTFEAALADIWRNVLGRRHIGRNDNFFEIGGTSLKAVQMVATIKAKLNQNLSIVTLFECPTVALLAAKLGATADGRSVAGAAAAAHRGGQRRHKAIRKKSS